jgi:hypothetical protein
MNTTSRAAAVTAAAAGLGLVITQVRRSRARGPETEAGAEPRNRWRSVTVNKPAGQVAPDGTLPEPLAKLGDRVEVRVTPAPGGKGTEIAARLRDPEPDGAAARLAGHDPRQAVRLALRESKALLEAGEVLRVDPQPAGRRAATASGKLLDLVEHRARAEGVL